MRDKEPTEVLKQAGHEVVEKIKTDEGRTQFQETLEHKRRSYGHGRRRWSFVYHITLYLSAILSAAAALVPRLTLFDGSIWKDDMTSVLAAAASLSIAISTAGGFGRKWIASRTSKGLVEQIQIELLGRDPTLADVKKLAQIEVDHDRAVVGG